MRENLSAGSDYQSKEGLGFTFYAYNGHEMLGAIWRAVDMYYNDKENWQQIIKNDMSTDFSWAVSAAKYADLYDGLLK